MLLFITSWVGGFVITQQQKMDNSSRCINSSNKLRPVDIVSISLLSLFPFSFLLFIVGFVYPSIAYVPLITCVGDFKFIFTLVLLGVLSYPLFADKFGISFQIGIIKEVHASQILYWVRRLVNPITVAVLITALALKAAIFPHWGMFNDEGIWYYVANAWDKYGLLPYQGTIENKTPGIFYIFYLTNHFFGLQLWVPRILAIISLVATSVLLYGIGRRLYNHRTGMLVMFFFGFSMTTLSVESISAAQVESFMLCFTALAFYLLCLAQQTDTTRKYHWLLFFAACSMGVAILFKQIAILTLFGFLAFYFFTPPSEKKTRHSWKQGLLIIISGIFLVHLIGLIPLLIRHVSILEYLNGAWLILLKSGSTAPSIQRRLMWAQATLLSVDIRCYYLLILTFILLISRLKASRIPVAGLLCWAFFDFLGANAAGTYYGHQLKQMLPAFAIITGITVEMLLNGQLTRRPLPSLHRVLVVGILFCIWWPVMLAPAAATSRFTVVQEFGQWLHNHTSSRDYIYIFGRDSVNKILAYSGRRSSSRYFNQFFIRTPGVEAQIQQDVMITHPPKYIVFPADGKISNLHPYRAPRWLRVYLATHYDLVPCRQFEQYYNERKNGYYIFIRKPDSRQFAMHTRNE